MLHILVAKEAHEGSKAVVSEPISNNTALPSFVNYLEIEPSMIKNTGKCADRTHLNRAFVNSTILSAMLRRAQTGTWLPAYVPNSSVTVVALLMACSMTVSTVCCQEPGHMLL